MTEPCVWKTNSILPVCGVHRVNLLQTAIPIDPNAPHLGMIDCYVCPIGLVILREDTIERN
jgi:hypothetical protein